MTKRKKPKIEEGQFWLLPFDRKKLTVTKVDIENDRVHYIFFYETGSDTSYVSHDNFYAWIKEYRPTLAGSPTKIWKQLNESNKGKDNEEK